jgi:hypothetical protein
MKTIGKYDAIVLQALAQRIPVAGCMRRNGFSDAEIRSCQGMLRSIKSRVAPEDQSAWQQRKRLVYLNRRREALERLESGKSKSEAGDVQLVETYDRVLGNLPFGGVAPDSSPESIIIDL